MAAQAPAVFPLQFAALAQMVIYSQAKPKESERNDQQRRSIHRHREAGELLIDNVGGAERQKRQAEEKGEIGALHGVAGFLYTLCQVLVIEPVNTSKRERA